jgi:hypothetical protein
VTTFWRFQMETGKFRSFENRNMPADKLPNFVKIALVGRISFFVPFEFLLFLWSMPKPRPIVAGTRVIDGTYDADLQKDVPFGGHYFRSTTSVATVVLNRLKHAGNSETVDVRHEHVLNTLMKPLPAVRLKASFPLCDARRRRKSRFRLWWKIKSDDFKVVDNRRE